MKNKHLFTVLLVIFTFGSFVFTQETPENDFKKIIENRLKKSNGAGLLKVCPVDSDSTAKQIFREYGAVFVSQNVTLPEKCIFEDEKEVQAFQASVKSMAVFLGGVKIELQSPAMDALLRAQNEAKYRGLKITPFDGSIAGRRSYTDTWRLWNSRFYPALNYWVANGQISLEDSEAVRKMPVKEQVAKVLKWEEKGLYFSRSLRHSILNSVAPPGASQHIFMLAFDVEQYADRRIREILARHGWFQTVRNDFTHFTYLGVEEKELPSLGLKAFFINNHKFWLPVL